MKFNHTQRAQTVMELAIFGAILLFILGIIIRSALNFGLVQNQSLRAMRMAMSMSYKTSEGMYNTGSLNKHGVSSRNSANILIVEDRLVAGSSKYGPTDRNPFITVGTASHTRNLFQPLDVGDKYSEPVYDVFINGKHFPFTIARIREVSAENEYYVMIPNNPSIAGYCAEDPCGSFSADERFDLNRDGVLNAADGDVIGLEYRNHFSWQWDKVTHKKLKKGIRIADVPDIRPAAEVSGVTGGEKKPVKIDFHTADVDNDLKEENIIKVESSKIYVLDLQEGDMDFSISNNDPQKRPGIEPDVFMYTETKPGHFLRIEEGKLFGPAGQFVRTSSKKDHVDLIERIITVSNDTGRFCDDGFVQNSDKIWPKEKAGFLGIKNPVEQCFDCTLSENRAKTCYDPDAGVIYVRSRVYEGFGHQWTTDERNDPYINLK